MKRIMDIATKKADLQIAPLIDVVFLLLIYFMVTASLIKKEADLSFLLPAPLPGLVGNPIEVLVQIPDQGVVLAEGVPFTDMTDLASHLATLKAAADLSSSELVVNILPDDHARHGRIVGVMDACAKANVKNMSFVTAAM